MPDEDDLADKYELADATLRKHGLTWYEVSNWATDESQRCRHNMLYWQGGDWWGVGPGAHSHVGGTRWWNVKHPKAYADRIGAEQSPAHAREILADGLPADALDDEGRAALPEQVRRGLVTVADDTIFLTETGRLLADAVVRDLLP